MNARCGTIKAGLIKIYNPVLQFDLIPKQKQVEPIQADQVQKLFSVTPAKPANLWALFNLDSKELIVLAAP